MKTKLHALLIALLVALLVSGCASTKFTGLEDVSEKEAVAVAKIRILHNGKDVTKGSTVIFNAPYTGIIRYAYKPDEAGYIFAKLPVGNNRLNTILHPNQLTQHRFGDEELTCQLLEGKGIYYIGDITLDWRGMGSAGSWMLFAAVGGIPGALAGAAAGQGGIVATVESNEVPAQEALRRRFSTDRNVIPSLLVVNPQPSTKH